MKIVKLILIAFGFYVLYTTVRDVGVENLWRNISALQWQLLPLFIFYALVFAFNTLGWIHAFPARVPKHVPFRDFYLIRVIGETVNGIVPFSASLGGEPVKVEMLKRRHGVPLSEGIASILVVHTTFWSSLNLFVIGALLLSMQLRPLTPILWNSVLIFLSGLGIIGLALLMSLYFGVFKQLHAIGEKWKLWGKLSDEKSVRFTELDGYIRSYFTEHPRRFFLSTIWNLLAWMSGALETWYAARILGIELSLADAWIFEALIQVLRIVTFFIPSSIGVQEGGIVFIFSQFGIPDPLSLTYAVIRRLREIVWMAFALLLWSFWRIKKN